MSRSESRAWRRTARETTYGTQFLDRRGDLIAQSALLEDIRRAQFRVWAVLKNLRLTDDETVLVERAAAPHLAERTPGGIVHRRSQQRGTKTNKPSAQTLQVHDE